MMGRSIFNHTKILGDNEAAGVQHFRSRSAFLSNIFSYTVLLTINQHRFVDSASSHDEPYKVRKAHVKSLPGQC